MYKFRPLTSPLQFLTKLQVNLSEQTNERLKTRIRMESSRPAGREWALTRVSVRVSVQDVNE